MHTSHMRISYITKGYLLNYGRNNFHSLPATKRHAAEKAHHIYRV